MFRIDIADKRGDGEPLHKPVELFGIHLPEFVIGVWPGEMSAVNQFGKEKKTIVFQYQSFDFTGRTSAEKKEGIWNE